MVMREPVAAVPSPATRLPLGGLCALALAGFITLMTEVMPAGLLPQISTGLGITESMAGQFVTAFAVGCLVAPMPLMAFTQTMRRRPLLVIALCGFCCTNAATAISDRYWVIIAARLFAGMFGGIVWALLVGYAARMVSSDLVGRAIAVACACVPLAFSLGVPIGTWVGINFGWRIPFAMMSGLAVILVGWSLVKLPDFPGQPSHKQISIGRVLRLPGLIPILFTMFTFILAHNILYSYIAPFLLPSGLANRMDLVLLVFGAAGVLGLWIVGAFIDRYPRRLVITILSLFFVVALTFCFAGESPTIVLAGVFVWGGVTGGAPTLFQTAEAKVAGEATDLAQAVFVTVWNTGVACGGFFGGLLLDTYGARSFAWTLLMLAGLALFVSWRAGRYAFPSVSDEPSP